MAPYVGFISFGLGLARSIDRSSYTDYIMALETSSFRLYILPKC